MSESPISSAAGRPVTAHAPALPVGFAALPWLAKLNLLLLAGLATALTTLLWPHWSDNPDLSHGWLMPLIFLLLLHEARHGTPRFLAPSARTQAATLTLLALGLLALGASGLYAAALDWTHALVAFTLTISLVLFLGAGLVAFASRPAPFLAFNWSALVAIALWLLAAPIPPGSYLRLTLGLQLAITQNVLRALHVLGIAATRHGNIIDLANTTVGVEDACSGVRSLIACVFAGLLFSATLVRSPWARALLIVLAGPLAIAMNFVRSLLLTLLANGGTDISGTWHDVTGFGVLAVTAALLAGLALVLERTSRASRIPIRTDPPDQSVSIASSRSRLPHLLLAPGLALAIALTVLFVANTRPSIRHDVPVPNLASILPAQVDGWHVETTKDLYQFTSTLKTVHLAQRTYLRRTAEGVDQVTVYLAYWRAGQAPVSLVASHTPDACWPGSGWAPATAPSPRARISAAGRPLAEAEARLFRNAGHYAQHVWFWHLYDGHPIAYRDPYSPRELLRIAWNYGFSHNGDQLFVRVSSNRPWTAIADTPVIAEIFGRLEPLGL